MPENGAKLTVFFQEPFWVGLYERWTEGLLQVCKITFGAEPKDYQVYEFLLNHWDGLRFSPPVAEEKEEAPRKNPKRVQREIQRQLASPPTSTRSQQALSLQREAAKEQRRQRSHQGRETQRQERFALRQKKRKEKHRGR
ncbi:MAG: YjdF family protein [Acutalibacter sp.]